MGRLTPVALGPRKLKSSYLRLILTADQNKSDGTFMVPARHLARTAPRRKTKGGGIPPNDVRNSL
jgi:hypothetical protein